MRILAVAGTYPSSSNPSRASFYFRLLDEFAHAGHDVCVIVPLKMGVGRRSALLPKTLKPIFVPYIPTGQLAWRGDRVSVTSIVKSVLRAVSQQDCVPDAIYAHFLMPAGYAAAEVSRSLGVPAFCSLGESRCESWFTQMRRDVVLETLNGFRCIFPVAKHIASFLREVCRVDPARIEVVRNGVDERIFRRIDKVECRRALGLSPQKKIALFVGSADRRKGGEIVAGAGVHLGSEWEVLIVGPGHRYPAAPNVRLVGAVDQLTLSLYYNAADVFLLPSEAEGMPNSLLEAIACRTPVIVSRIPPHVELLGVGYPYYCERSPGEIASLIRKFQAQKSSDVQLPRTETLRARASRILQCMSLHVN